MNVYADQLAVISSQVKTDNSSVKVSSNNLIELPQSIISGQYGSEVSEEHVDSGSDL